MKMSGSEKNIFRHFFNPFLLKHGRTTKAYVFIDIIVFFLELHQVKKLFAQLVNFYFSLKQIDFSSILSRKVRDFETFVFFTLITYIYRFLKLL